MQAIGGLFGGGGKVDPAVKAAQAQQRAALEKQEKDLAKREAEEKRRKASRDNLLAAIQGRSNSGTLFASAGGVDDKQAVLG